MDLPERSACPEDLPPAIDLSQTSSGRKRKSVQPRKIATEKRRYSTASAKKSRKKSAVTVSRTASSELLGSQQSSPVDTASESEYELPESATVHLTVLQGQTGSSAGLRTATLAKWDVSFEEIADWIDSEMAPLGGPANPAHYTRIVEGAVVKMHPKKTGLYLVDRAESWEFLKAQYRQLSRNGSPYNFQFQYRFQPKENFTGKTATARQHDAIARGSEEFREKVLHGRDLRERWKCITHGALCYVDSENNHYRICNGHIQPWCDAIENKECSIDDPPASILEKLIAQRPIDEKKMSGSPSAGLNQSTIQMIIKAELYDLQMRGTGTRKAPKLKPLQKTTNRSDDSSHDSPVSPPASSDICANETDDRLLQLFAESLLKHSPQLKENLEVGLANCEYESIGFLVLRQLLYDNKTADLKELGFNKGSIYAMQRNKSWRPNQTSATSATSRNSR